MWKVHKACRSVYSVCVGCTYNQLEKRRTSLNIGTLRVDVRLLIVLAILAVALVAAVSLFAAIHTGTWTPIHHHLTVVPKILSHGH